MSLTHPRSFYAGAVFLFSVWVWPLPHLPLPHFSSHMLMHMVVVALAAPLLAWGLVGSGWDPIVARPKAWSPVLASMVEFAAVWSWHLPRFHQLARTHRGYFVAEQSTFLLAGLALWLTAWGGTKEQRSLRSIGGVAGLLLTSMHMTLLGALIALAKRPLYGHGGGHSGYGLVKPLIDHRLFDQHVTDLQLVDQQVGGAIMLFFGATSYLFGAVLLAKTTWFSKFNPAQGEFR